jgi:DNA repair protein SbcD/Mre11
LPSRPPLRLLHASDLHLHHSHPLEAALLVGALGDAATAAGASALLLAGDVFDSSNQPAAFVESVAEAFRSIRIPVVAIPGNHDIRYSERDGDAFGTLASLLDPHHHCFDAEDGATIEMLGGGVHVWGRAMRVHTPENDPLQGLRAGLHASANGHGWRIALAHGELVDGPTYRSSPIRLDRHDEALSGVDYVALGHHHSPSARRYGRTLVAYSGSASTIVGPGSYALVTLSEAATAVEHRSLPIG